MKLILSLSHLRHNSGGQNHFQGGKMPSLPPPRTIPDLHKINFKKPGVRLARTWFKKYFVNFSLWFLNHHMSEFYGVSITSYSVQCM